MWRRSLDAAFLIRLSAVVAAFLLRRLCLCLRLCLRVLALVCVVVCRVGYRSDDLFPTLRALRGPRFEKESMMKCDGTMMDTERRIAVTAHYEDGEDDAEGAKGWQ